jgi:aspartyl protease family protein
MLRGYLVLVVALGVVASMVGSHARPAREDPAGQVHMVDGGTRQEQSTEPVAANLQEGAVQLQRQENGHFYADVELNGTPVHMLVDTGATAIALSRDDARKAGIATSIGMNDVIGQGADGSVHGEFVAIDRVSLGRTTAEHMPAMVLNSGEQSLLGQQFLQKFTSVEIHGDTMTLH